MIATRGAAYYSPIGGYRTPQLTGSVRYVVDPDKADERAWTELIDDLLAFRNLRDDWDGQGAVAPQLTLVDGAIRLAQRLFADGLCPADRVIAGVNGTIFFEWFGPQEYLEIEVVEPNLANLSVVDKGSEKAEIYTWADWAA